MYPHFPVLLDGYVETGGREVQACSSNGGGKRGRARVTQKRPGTVLRNGVVRAEEITSWERCPELLLWWPG